MKEKNKQTINCGQRDSDTPERKVLVCLKNPHQEVVILHEGETVDEMERLDPAYVTSAVLDNVIEPEISIDNQDLYSVR